MPKHTIAKFKVEKLGDGYVIVWSGDGTAIAYFKDKYHAWAARQQASAVVKRLNSIKELRCPAQK